MNFNAPFVTIELLFSRQHKYFSIFSNVEISVTSFRIISNTEKDAGILRINEKMSFSSSRNLQRTYLNRKVQVLSKCEPML